MKRAMFVGAGTVAGLLASLSYTPGVLQAIGGPLEARHTATGGKSTKASPVSERESNGATHIQRQQKKHSDGQSKANNQQADKSSNHHRSASPNSDSGSSSHSNAGQGSGSSSGSDSSVKPTPKPTPTHTSKPKPTHAPSPHPTPSPTARSYEGKTVSTPFGPVQISITVLDGRITDATAIQYPDADPKSVEIANKALPILRKETLSAQSASISSVSGASFTSKGWISSLQSALSKAHL